MAATGNTEAECDRNIDVDESEDAVKTEPGWLFGYYIFNAAASTQYVKFYDGTVASVIVGTTVPKLTIPVPAGAAANLGLPFGIRFGTAITVAATTGIGTSDTGAPATNSVIVNTFYK